MLPCEEERWLWNDKIDHQVTCYLSWGGGQNQSSGHLLPELRRSSLENVSSSFKRSSSFRCDDSSSDGTLCADAVRQTDMSQSSSHSSSTLATQHQNFSINKQRLTYKAALSHYKETNTNLQGGIKSLHCVSKKYRYPFYFCSNFFICESIFIIFGSNMPEEIWNNMYIVFPTTSNLCVPTLPCNTSGKSD